MPGEELQLLGDIVLERLADVDAEVVLVEEHRLGGGCLLQVAGGGAGRGDRILGADRDVDGAGDVLQTRSREAPDDVERETGGDRIVQVVTVGDEASQPATTSGADISAVSPGPA